MGAQPVDHPAEQAFPSGRPLGAIERELLGLAQAEKRRWQAIARLLIEVEQGRLWEGTARSFTAWINALARRADLEASTFWRCLKAARIYLDFSGSSELDASAKVSAESLELADKILRHAPKAVAKQVLQRTVDGELTRAELREVWATYRPAAGGNTARGRLPTSPEAREEAIASRRVSLEAEKRKPDNRAGVQRGELLAAFREASWLGPYDQCRAETHVAKLGGKLSAVLSVRPSQDCADRIDLHGLWTCLSEPELSDFEFKAPSAMDFMWLAVPATLSARTREVAPHMLGILELTRARAARVVRAAERRRTEGRARLGALSELLQRAYLWP